MVARERDAQRRVVAVAEGLALQPVFEHLDLVEVRDAQTRAHVAADGGDLRRDGILLRLIHRDGTAGLDNPRLLPRDKLHGAAEQRRVVEPDVRDHGAVRAFDDVRRVESAAEPDLQHHDVAALRREMQQRRRRRALEDRELIAALRLRRADALRRRREVRVRDLRAVYADALGKAQQVRRGEKPRAVARGAQNGREHRRGAALAVRPRNVDKAQRVLHIAEPRHHRPHRRKRRRPRPRRGVNVFECFLWSHD